MGKAANAVAAITSHLESACEPVMLCRCDYRLAYGNEYMRIITASSPSPFAPSSRPRLRTCFILIVYCYL